MAVRVLLAASDLEFRKLMENVVRSNPVLELAGLAGTGSEAVRKAKRISPDIILVGPRLQDGDGAETVTEIMIESPVPTVLVSRSDLPHLGDLTARALDAGALAVIPAPITPTGQFDPRSVGKFVSTIAAMSQVKVVRRWRGRPAAPPRPERSSERCVSVVGIVASTGGPAALMSILRDMPADFAAPILVVQHISVGFVAGTAAYLNEAVPPEVTVATDGALMKPGTVYFAPDGKQLGVSDRARIRVRDDPAINGFRPSGTYLFQSIARAFGRDALAVVLTGMGNDGTEGLRAIQEAGGRSIAQDEHSSVVYGMPSAAVAAGLVDLVLPLGEIPGEIIRMVGRGEDAGA